MWWEYFREGPSRGPVKETLQRIDQCLRLQPWTKDQFQELLPAVEARATTLVEPKRSEWWNGLGETCLLFGMREEAVRCFEQAAVFSSSDCLRLGDFFAGEQRWDLAADWYRRASEFEKTAGLPMFLHAQALAKSRQLAEARRLEQIAAALPLGNDAARRELAAGLKQRGYRDDSLQQFELLARTGVPGEHDQIEALKQIGNAIYPQEELRAANCWESMVLCCLRTKWGFADANGYIQIPFLVHKTRAKGRLRVGCGGGSQGPVGLASQPGTRRGTAARTAESGAAGRTGAVVQGDVSSELAVVRSLSELCDVPQQSGLVVRAAATGTRRGPDPCPASH
jgi:hypothetical protein